MYFSKFHKYFFLQRFSKKRNISNILSFNVLKVLLALLFNVFPNAMCFSPQKYVQFSRTNLMSCFDAKKRYVSRHFKRSVKNEKKYIKNYLISRLNNVTNICRIKFYYYRLGMFPSCILLFGLLLGGTYLYISLFQENYIEI